MQELDDGKRVSCPVCKENDIVKVREKAGEKLYKCENCAEHGVFDWFTESC